MTEGSGEEQPSYEPLCRFDQDYAAYAEHEGAFQVPVVNRVTGDNQENDPLPSVPHIVAYSSAPDGPAQTVAISGWAVDVPNMKAILSAMTASNTSTLRLSYASVGNDAFRLLSRHVRQGVLRHLFVDWNSPKDGEEIEAAQYGSLLDTQVVSTDEEVALGSALQTLSLRGCGISEAGASGIANKLKTNSILTQISLFHNNIGNNGAKSLSMSLRHNRALRVLDLSECGLSDEGATSLFEVLRPFQLQHSEVVERRKLLADPNRDDPESPRRTSLSKTGKAKTLSLKKKERKPSAKKSSTIGGKSKPKSAKSSRAQSHMDEVETDFANWLTEATLNMETKTWSVAGNRMLVAITLNKNPIGGAGQEQILKTLKAQREDGAGGLFRVCLEGLPESDSMSDITDMLAALDPLNVQTESL